MIRKYLQYGAAVLLVLSPIAAMAHVRTVASTPADGSAVAKVSKITLKLSDVLDPGRTSVELVMTAMPGVKNHGLMMIRNFQTGWSADRKTITLNLRKSLQKGSYEVRWHSSGADGHKMKGVTKFDVR